MDGVHEEVNGSVQGNARINTNELPLTCLQEVAAHPVLSLLTWQLFKLPATLSARTECTKSPQSPMHFVSIPSPCAAASNIVPSDDELIIACIQALRRKRATLASQMALM
jgi:hypothetical protein